MLKGIVSFIHSIDSCYEYHVFTLGYIVILFKKML